MPEPNRKKEQQYYFWGNPSVKDAIEAQGIPHAEVDLIVIDHRSVGFDYRLKDGDRVAVYPVFESLDIAPLVRLRPEPLRNVKFSVDGNMGNLARWLRLLGFDTRCDMQITKAEFIDKALCERRIILTKDRNVLKQKAVTHGYFVRGQDSDLQIREVLERFDLRTRLKPFTRCMVCNGILNSIKKETCRSVLPEKVLKYFDQFRQCQKCKKIYWEGSHYTSMTAQIKRLLAEQQG